MKSKIEFPITGVKHIKSIQDVCQFYSELTETFGIGWHPDHPFDTLHDFPGGFEEAEKIKKLMRKALKVTISAGIEDPYGLAYASTRKIREPFGIGTDYDEPLAALFK